MDKSTCESIVSCTSNYRCFLEDDKRCVQRKKYVLNTKGMINILAQITIDFWTLIKFVSCKTINMWRNILPKVIFYIINFAENIKELIKNYVRELNHLYLQVILSLLYSDNVYIENFDVKKKKM